MSFIAFRFALVCGLVGSFLLCHIHIPAKKKETTTLERKDSEIFSDCSSDGSITVPFPSPPGSSENEEESFETRRRERDIRWLQVRNYYLHERHQAQLRNHEMEISRLGKNIKELEGKHQQLDERMYNQKSQQSTSQMPDLSELR